MMRKICALMMSGLLSTMACASVETLQAQIAKQYPNLKIENIQKTEMTGLYSATVDGQIIYLGEDGQYLLTGSMIRLKDQKNLTNELILQQHSVDWKKLPLKDAIKTVRGTGKRQLAVFSDPNCPYCKRLDAELAKLQNVTIYTFIYPIKPQSIEVSKQVWCEQKPDLAWQNLLQKNIMPTAKSTCSNPIQRNLNLGQQLGLEGTPSIIFSNGFKTTGAYPAEQIEMIWNEFGL